MILNHYCSNNQIKKQLCCKWFMLLECETDKVFCDCNVHLGCYSIKQNAANKRIFMEEWCISWCYGSNTTKVSVDIVLFHCLYLLLRLEIVAWIFSETSFRSQLLWKCRFNFTSSILKAIIVFLIIYAWLGYFDGYLHGLEVIKHIDIDHHVLLLIVIVIEI